MARTKVYTNNEWKNAGGGHTLLTGDKTVAVAATTTTQIDYMTLPAGKWIINAFGTTDVSGSGLCVLGIDVMGKFGRAARGSQSGGGGVCNCVISNFTTPQDIKFTGYAGAACNFRVMWEAVRLDG